MDEEGLCPLRSLTGRRENTATPRCSPEAYMDTNVIVVDRIGNVALGNGIVRIECVSASAARQEKIDIMSYYLMVELRCDAC